MSIPTDIRHKFSTTPGAVPTPDDFKFEGVKSPGILAVNGGDGRIFTLLADLTTVVCTSDPTKLASAIPASQINVANGVAGLDATGHLPIALFPALALSGLHFKGTWDATGAAPSATPVEGEFWIVSTAGTTDLGGETDWQPKDWALYSGGAWRKVDNTEPAITAISGGTF
jgi:hypothetical protein